MLHSNLPMRHAPMITSLMNAMREQAPAETRKLQRRSPTAWEDHVLAVVKRTHETMDPGGKIAAQGPNEAQMLHEAIFHEALAELTSPLSEKAPETM